LRKIFKENKKEKETNLKKQPEKALPGFIDFKKSND